MTASTGHGFGRAAAVGLLVCALVGSARAALSISPAFVDVSLDKGRPTGRFEITNLGDETERFRINTMHFVFSKDGGLKQMRPDEHSLAQWIRFNPKEFELRPKSRQVVRFVILAPGGLKPGEYWAGMEVEPLKTTVGAGKDAAGRQFQIEVVSTILVPIFGTVGKTSARGLIRQVNFASHPRGPVLQSVVANMGSSRLVATGKYTIRDSSGKLVAEGHTGKAYILAGTERRFSSFIRTPLEEGQYTVAVQYSCPQLKQDLTHEQKLVWKPAKRPTTRPAATTRPATRPSSRPKRSE